MGEASESEEDDFVDISMMSQKIVPPLQGTLHRSLLICMQNILIDLEKYSKLSLSQCH